MKFTHNELVSIEKTMEKLLGVARTMCNTESTDYTNARYIAYIVSEMRNRTDNMGLMDGKTLNDLVTKI